jgi:hypothetical protein
MAEISKQALKVDNNQSFPNNNNGAITPAILRAFNVNMIDSMVDELSYNVDSASWNQQIDALEQFSASASGLTTGSLLVTASAEGNVITFTKGNNSTFNVTVATGSGGDVTALNAFTASQLVINSGYNTFTQSANTSLSNLNSATGSYVTETESGSFLVTASFDNGTRNLTFTKGDASTFNVNIPDVSGSTGNFATTGSNTFVGNQTISGSLFISGSEVVAGPVTASRLQINGVTDLNGTLDVSNDATFRGDVYIQSSGNPKLRLRDTAGGGHSDGFDIQISTASFVITDETHDINFFEFDYDDVSQHTLKFEANRFEMNSGSLGISGSLTASLQEGYVWVGDGNNVSTLVATSSFGGGSTIDTGSFATTGSNSFNGDQNITGSVRVSSQILFGTASLGASMQALEATGLQVNAGESGSFSMRTLYGAGVGVANIEAYDTFPSFTKGGKVSTKSAGGVDIIGYDGQIAITGSSLVMQGFTYPTTDGTSGQVLTTNGSKVLSFTTVSGGGGTTFENPSVESISGSLLLTANTFTSGAASINHLSASAGGKVNLIFKNNNTTADTIISGSNNILSNPATPTVGFKRYIGNNNIAIGGAFPQISGSMQFSPTINGNYIIGGAPSIRGPISASLMNVNTNVMIGNINIGTTAVNNAEKLTGQTQVINNFVAGQINLVANQSEIRTLTNVPGNNVNGFVTLNLSSSATSFSQNTINDSNFTFTNQFSSGGIGFGQTNVSNNTIGGTGNILIATGSQPVLSPIQAGFSQNLLLGAFNTAFVNSSESRISGTNVYHQLIATSLLGQRLIVTGSSNLNDTTSIGSAFVGRFNAADGIRDKSSDVVFAVGTGTSVSNRKTGFLIDSGSNSFFEGVVSVSGSLFVNGVDIVSGSGGSINTGSLLVTASFDNGTRDLTFTKGDASTFAVNIPDVSGSTISTASFATTGSNLFIGNQTITGSVSIQGDTTFTLSNGDPTIVRLGASAMSNAITNGNSINVAIGNSAMQNASGSSQNVAIGNRALFRTTGSLNVAIGSEAMPDNTTGTQNFAMGVNALNKNTSGDNNVAIGVNAIQNMVVSKQQIAIGADSLKSMTNGGGDDGQNIAIGYAAMQNVITASANTVIGIASLRDARDADENVFIGGTSGINASGSISSNTAIGNRTAQKIAGSDNTFIGHASATNMVVGSTNTFIGKNTGANIVTGSRNTLIGGLLSGQNNWNNVIAISDGNANIKFFNSGSRTTLTNDTLISGSLTTTGSANIGTVMTLTPLDPLPTGALGGMAVSGSNLYFHNGTGWQEVLLVL